MSPWGWNPVRTEGIWRYGAKWMKPIAASFPWLTLILLVQMMYMIGGTLTSSKGVLFDLPSGSLEDGQATRLVALVMPVVGETLVFFDDARYKLGESDSVDKLVEQLSYSTAAVSQKTLLVLADRRVAGGDLMKLASIARKGGVEKILFAEKKQEIVE